MKYINRDKGVSIKLGNAMTEHHGLDTDKTYPSLQLLTEWLGTYSRVVIDLHAVPRAQK
jgi:hypothetical protein